MKLDVHQLLWLFISEDDPTILTVLYFDWETSSKNDLQNVAGY